MEYKLNFVSSESEPLVLLLDETEVENFDVYIRNKFDQDQSSIQAMPQLQGVNPEETKTLFRIGFYPKAELFDKLTTFIHRLNKRDKITEVLIHIDDELFCDLTNVIGVSLGTNLQQKIDYALIIVEGMEEE